MKIHQFHQFYAIPLKWVYFHENAVFCHFGGTYSKPYKNVAYSIGSEPPRGAKSENSTHFLEIHPIFGNFHKNHPKLWNYHKFRISGSRGALKSIGIHWHYVWFGASRQKSSEITNFHEIHPHFMKIH